MSKKLVFSFFISDDTYKSKINDIHLKCLEHYAHIFDDILVVFIKGKNKNNDNYEDAQKRLIKVFLGKSLSFKYIENTPFRESLVFYDNVATNLKNDDLVFFAHNKGISNNNYEQEEIYTWICGMYYFSLNFIDEVIDSLYNKKYYSYGSFLTKNSAIELEHPNKYGWYYIGTFFWINSKKLYQYMMNKSLDLPALSDRFYDEEFLGNIIDTYPLIMSNCHLSRFLINADNFYLNTRKYLSMLYEKDELEKFNNFYKMIKN